VGGREPFRDTRRDRPPEPDAEPDDRTDNERVEDAFEFCASEYGWTARTVETQLTDEQLELYARASSRRQRDVVEVRHHAAVEAVRLGTVFAYDADAARRWHRDVGSARGRSRGRGLTGQALENAILGMAQRRPDLVVMAD
jgi:hypothetical protein